MKVDGFIVKEFAPLPPGQGVTITVVPSRTSVFRDLVSADAWGAELWDYGAEGGPRCLAAVVDGAHYRGALDLLEDRVTSSTATSSRTTEGEAP